VKMSNATGTAEDRLANGKGKGRESKDENSGLENSPEAGQSMTSRVITSASRLAKDAVGSSNGHLPSTIASSSSLRGKSQSNGTPSGPSAWADTVSARPGPSLNGKGGGQSDLAPQESFRTQPTESSVASDYQDFIKDGPGLAAGLEINQSHLSSWTEDFRGRDFPNEQSQGSDVPGGSSNERDQVDFGALEQYDDGAEVRRLLSDPAFNALTDASDMMTMQEPSAATVNDLFPQLFTAEEQTVVDKIKSTLPAPPTYKSVPPNHPLNLRPRSNEEKESIHQEILDFGPTESNESLTQTMFSNQAQREEWVSEWDGVLNGYTDEVWGDLLPVVQAAKSQLEEVRTGTSTLDHKAIARLKMILGHISGQQATADATLSRQDSHFVGGKEKSQFHCPWASCHQVSLRQSTQSGLTNCH
jgi:hypothetical protein